MDETLVNQVVNLTGLPKNSVEKVIKNWILETGKSPQDLGLEDLREVLVELVQKLFIDVANGDNQHITLSR